MEGFVAKDGETLAHKEIRLYAFTAITISTVAVVTAIITLPWVFTAVHAVRSDIFIETDFCKNIVSTQWHEMYTLGKIFHSNQTRQKRWDPSLWPSRNATRGKREWRFGQYVPDTPAAGGGYGSPAPAGYGPVAAPELAPQCCPCHQGPPGPAGEPGDDGKAGADGLPGDAGKDAKDGVVKPSAGLLMEPCIICPPGEQGPAGKQGEKGPPGPKGPRGMDGLNGKPGDSGMAGAAGPMGTPGGEGPVGKAGIPGKVRQSEGIQSPQGPEGPAGDKGIVGRKGELGKAGPAGEKGPEGNEGISGHPGKKGLKGPVGPPGSKGPGGDCMHCPPPRTPPGY